MNKKFLSILGVLALTVSLSVFMIMSDRPTAVEGDNAKATGEVGSVEGMTLVVLDVQGVINSSDASKNIQEQATELAKEYQSELSKLEEKLKSSHKKIIDENKDKSKEDRITAARSFEKELAEANKTANEKRRALEQAVEDATQQLRIKILEIVAKMATENEYDMVLSRQNVVIVSPDFDITDDVMERLNNELKEIELKVAN